MKRMIFLWAFLWLFYLAIFVAFKIPFILIYAMGQSGFAEIMPVFYYGLIMDISATGWIMLLNTLVIAAAPLLGMKTLKIILKVYNGLIFVFLSLLLISDLLLYHYWGFRIDATIFRYLGSPGEALASAGGQEIAGGIIAIAGLSLALFRFYRFIERRIFVAGPEKPLWYSAPIFVLLLAAHILPVRGGLQITPLAPGNVCFSSKPILNHAATNVFWNFCFSLDNLGSTRNPYIWFPDAVNEYEKTGSAESRIKIFRNDRPNIVFIIAESLTSEVMEYTGHYSGVTPWLDSVAEHGILFTQFYASGDRTDKGLVSLLSGYPSQPTDAVIKYPQKIQHLPQIPVLLKQAGYRTSFYYGGDIRFAGMDAYIRLGEYDRIMDKGDFSASEMNAKWGVHDHILFLKISEELQASSEPFFSVILTLSNHEPFETPDEYGRNDGKDEAGKFLNTCRYTDWSIRNFVESCRGYSWFSNTVFVVVADHGHTLPGNKPFYSLQKYHIPLLIFGEGLAVSDTIISTIASQEHFAATLLAQLGIQYGSFTFSENILSPTFVPFGFYTFNNGFGYVCNEGHVIFDQNSGKHIEAEGSRINDADSLARLHMQQSYRHFLELQFGDNFRR